MSNTSPIGSKKKSKPQKVEREIPGSDNGMFLEYYEFDPDETFNSADLIAILKALKLRFDTKTFNELPKSTKQQFMVQTRTGEKFRYTANEERMLARRLNSQEQ